MNEILNPVDNCQATVIRNVSNEEKAGAQGRFYAECYDKDGNLKWTDEIDNQVMNEAKNFILDYGLANSGTFVATVMGLVTNTSFTAYAATQTYAAHTSSGWTESTAYAARQSISWSAASGGSKATSSAVTFAITGTDTVRGCCVFFTATTTPGDTAASSSKLVSAGDFSGGNKSVSNGDSISVTYTFSI